MILKLTLSGYPTPESREGSWAWLRRIWYGSEPLLFEISVSCITFNFARAFIVKAFARKADVTAPFIWIIAQSKNPLLATALPH